MTILIDADAASTVTTTGHLDKRMTCITVGFPGIDGCGTSAVQYVQSVRRWDHMAFSGSHARCGSTCVIEVQSVWDLADHELVDDTMSPEKMLLPIFEAFAPDEAIAEFIGHPFPEPAPIGLCEAMPSVSERSGLGTSHTCMVTQKLGMVDA